MNGIEQTEAYLGVLVRDAHPDAFVEIRWFTPNGPRQEWHRIGDLGFACADRIGDLGSRFNTYVGALPRTRQGGKAADVGVGHVAWADLDTAAAVAALRTFPLPPTMIVRSGSRDGNVAKVHPYWALSEAVPGARIEAANRQLAKHLGADDAWDRARILRPPGTFNFKGRAPAPVELAELHPERRVPIEAIEAAVGSEPADREPENVQPFAPRERPGDDPLTAFFRGRSAPEYFRLLAGIEAVPGQKVRCPVPGHEDRHPSCHVYPGDRGWWCYSCRRGGGIFELAAVMMGKRLPLRGVDFLTVREALRTIYERELLGVAS